MFGRLDEPSQSLGAHARVNNSCAAIKRNAQRATSRARARLGAPMIYSRSFRFLPSLFRASQPASHRTMIRSCELTVTGGCHCCCYRLDVVGRPRPSCERLPSDQASRPAGRLNLRVSSSNNGRGEIIRLLEIIQLVPKCRSSISKIEAHDGSERVSERRGNREKRWRPGDCLQGQSSSEKEEKKRREDNCWLLLLSALAAAVVCRLVMCLCFTGS